MKTTAISAALLTIATLTGASNASVAIGSMTYDFVTYTAGQTVRIYRQQPANIVVRGANLHLANASQIVNSSGAPAPGLTATIIGRRTNEITVLVNSTSAAAYADYSIRIRFPVEPSGPDVFRVRLFQRGTVSSLAIEGASPTSLVVGTSYTLVATGSNLDRIACCGDGFDAGNVSVTMASRTTTSAQFTLVMKQGYAEQIRASMFYDGNLPSAPSACNTACYSGSASLILAGAVSPTITSVTPYAPNGGASASINGSNLAPIGWSVQLLYQMKYVPVATSNRAFTNLTGATSAVIPFGVPRNMRSDSIFLIHMSPGQNAERMVSQNNAVPPVFVKEPPVVTGTGAIVLALLNDTYSNPLYLLKPGTATILGKHLLSPPTQVTAPTSLTSGSRTAVTGGLATLGSPLPPSVTFGSTTLTVQSAVYDPGGSQPVLSGPAQERGVDRVTVTVPDLGTNQSGTISVTTAAGTATLGNVVFATTPRITRVEEAINPTASGSATGKLFRNAEYTIVGSAMQLLRNNGSGWSIVQNPTLKLNGRTIPVLTSAVTSMGTRLTFTVPAAATSGALTVETAGGIGNAGTFTVSDAPIAPRISGFVISPNPILGGTTTTATVAFAGTIPPDGSAGQIALSVPTADQGAVPPIAPITITANPMTIQVPTRLVTATRSVAVSVALTVANATSSTLTAPLTINPPQPTQLVLSQATTTGGASVAATVQLNGSAPLAAGVPVMLWSSDPTVATVPATATVDGSSARFTVMTVPTQSQRTVTITANSGGVSQTATLVIEPPALAGVSTAVSRVISGRPTTGTITLTGPMAGASAQLSVNSSWAHVPTTVTLSALSTNFTITTSAVQDPKPVTITATVNGVARSATLTLDPVFVQSVTISPTTVAAGGTATVTVRLSAPAVGTMQPAFSLSDSTAATIPRSVLFSEGQDVAVVALTAKSPITATRSLTVTATLTRHMTSASSPTTPLGLATSSASTTVSVIP